MTRKPKYVMRGMLFISNELWSTHSTSKGRIVWPVSSQHTWDRKKTSIPILGDNLPLSAADLGVFGLWDHRGPPIQLSLHKSVRLRVRPANSNVWAILY